MVVYLLTKTRQQYVGWCIVFLCVLSEGASMEINHAYSGLKIIPTDINPNVTNLVLSSNFISRVANYSFANLKELVTLNINRNQISYIEDGTFDMLAKLKQLKLARNCILYIPATFGDAERSLEKLGFYEAFAQVSMKSFDFSRFTKLRHLNIGGNDIPREQLAPRDRQLMSTYYENTRTLPRLEALYLPQNYLESVPDYFHLPLKNIYLAANRLACNASLCWVRLWEYFKSPMQVYATCNSPTSLKEKALMTAHPIAMECYKGNTKSRPDIRVWLVHHYLKTRKTLETNLFQGTTGFVTTEPRVLLALLTRWNISLLLNVWLQQLEMMMWKPYMQVSGSPC